MRRYVIRQETTVRIFDENEKQIDFSVVGGEVAVDIRGSELNQIIDDKTNEIATEVSGFAKSVLEKERTAGK